MYNNPEKLLTPLPIIDFAAANRANEAAHHYMERVQGTFLSLESALALLWYNHFAPSSTPAQVTFNPAVHTGSEGTIARLELISRTLVEQELNAAEVGNPRVPLSFEIEMPQQPFTANPARSRVGKEHDELFSSLKFPLNRDSLWIDDYFGSWEYSTRLAYSWYTQYILASELIRGNFVPHLLVGYDAITVREILSNSLISFHINLGMGTGISPFVPYGQMTDPLLLASSMAIAHSSPARLKYRKTQDAFYRAKQAFLSRKNPAGKYNRLEIVGLEIQNLSQLHGQLREAQNIGSALNAALQGPNTLLLVKEWQQTRANLLAIFAKFSLPLDFSDLYITAPTVDEEVKINLREQLAASSAAIENLIVDQYGAIPLPWVP